MRFCVKSYDERIVDSNQQWGSIVVKSPSIIAIAVSITLVCGAYGDGITNISQCMNTSLTAEVLATFPTNTTATAQNCVLAFVKGSVSGDLRMFASPFLDEIRISEFGFHGLDSVCPLNH